jgi:hypothetical protein
MACSMQRRRSGVFSFGFEKNGPIRNVLDPAGKQQMLGTPGSMPLHFQKEMTHYSETNDQRFNIDMNMRHIARNVM